MLSYRHAFHAGNHADVLKHFVQVQLHKYMNQKDTAYTYIDTHSGAGVYALDSDYASKNAEYATGIGPLWDCRDMPEPLAEYVDLVRAMNPSGKLRYYPGSPYIAEQMAREQDRLRLFELHPTDSKVLAENFRKLEAHKAEQGQRARGRRVMIERGDGFLSLKALLPPPSRRALVLIDPPYEVKDDYRRVKDALDEALGRFPSGIYAVWYPVLQRMESRQFADKLKRLPAKEWLHVTLTISTPTPDGVGLHTSGMFILNPPYTLEPLLRQVMPYLVRVLGKDAAATFHIEKGTQVTGAAAARTGAGPRQPVGNARRASPLAGTGSLRLPGQSMRADEDRQKPAGPQREAAPGNRQARPAAQGARQERPAVQGREGRPAGPARPKGFAGPGRGGGRRG
ncbi:23S rRNA (adenine(2030)-N(6))-methyltransferase RlmJ [Massilia agilis]|uniref:Ribosomal RNA large subunit methyltransferase J n=1 Tax=Massilia agilis TaxID=1811226 RepID=A0ABT2D671_9BURK|nr:23S rRNA (adenine(2030)-N(6))-methyltransferase RlmJ [Massilia agilis]MCS0806814.1 23S rRNA (adenine(2030)-N(6))-methyltransferase RlmJ [Massilia agilis]